MSPEGFGVPLFQDQPEIKLHERKDLFEYLKFIQVSSKNNKWS